MKTIKQLVLVCIVSLGVSFQVSWAIEENDESCKVVEQAKLECEWAVTKACVNLERWYVQIKEKRALEAAKELVNDPPRFESGVERILEEKLFSREELADEIKKEVRVVFDQWGEAEDKLVKSGNVSEERKNELRVSLESMKKQYMQNVADRLIPSGEKVSVPREGRDNGLVTIPWWVVITGAPASTLILPYKIFIWIKDTTDRERKAEELCGKLCIILDNASESVQMRLHDVLMKGVESRIAEWEKITL